MAARIARALGFAGILGISMLVAAQNPDVILDDLAIVHTSTVPANRGERVRLFARHYRTEAADRGVVIALSSDTLPADAGLGLDYRDYNHLRGLAGRGFGVFAADVTGYGLSPKPQMADGCNADERTQTELLRPYPLYIPCAPSYTRLLTSLASDWDEVDAIVEHARELTGDDRVVLMGWSWGAARAAGYAAQNPDKVERLVLIAPRYQRDAPAESPTEHPQGRPLRVHDVVDIAADWREAVRCEGWADVDGIVEQLEREVNEFDPTAAEWGMVPGNLFRSPALVEPDGFGRAVVGRIEVPTLIIRGLDDGRSTEAEALHEDLTIREKLLLNVECGTRWLIWEGSGEALQEAIAEYLESGTVEGRSSGVVPFEARR